jgi:putative addiction module component (TIGR02574 family)
MVVVLEARMDPTTVLQTVRSWPVSDQLEFLFHVWDELVECGWRPEPTEELKVELDRRLAAYQADPSKVATWEEAVARVRRPR